MHSSPAEDAVWKMGDWVLNLSFLTFFLPLWVVLSPSCFFCFLFCPLLMPPESLLFFPQNTASFSPTTHHFPPYRHWLYSLPWLKGPSFHSPCSLLKNPNWWTMLDPADSICHFSHKGHVTKEFELLILELWLNVEETENLGYQSCVLCIVPSTNIQGQTPASGFSVKTQTCAFESGISECFSSLSHKTDKWWRYLFGQYCVKREDCIVEVELSQ